MTSSALSHEAGVISRYLVGADPSAEEVGRWLDAVEALGKPLDQRSRMLWDSAMKHPRLLGFLDAGLALWDSKNPLRQRIYLMLAVLEASPQNAEFFLRVNRPAGLFEIFLAGARACGRSAVGALAAAGMSLTMLFRHVGKT